MTKLEAIRAFIAAGYPLIPLNGKKPLDNDWPKTKLGAYDEKTLAKEGQNYGVCLSATDLVIDVDPRSFKPGDRPFARLIQALGGSLPSFAVRTGGGGLHVYLKKPANLVVANTVKEYPGVEFKGGPGRQVVGPGSVHPESLKEYVITAGHPSKILDAPKALLDLIARKPKETKLTGTGEYHDDAQTQERYKNYLRGSARPSVQGQAGDNNAFVVAAYGRDLGLSPRTTYELMGKDWNDRCSPPWDNDELKSKVAHAYQYAKGQVGAAHPSAHFDKISEAKTPDTKGNDGSVSVSVPAAQVGWKLDNKGQPIKCFQNLLNYFILPGPQIMGIFGFNEFTQRVELIDRAPWHVNGNRPSKLNPRLIQDTDLQQMRAHLARKPHGYDTSISDLVDGMVDASMKNRFHPVRDYLSAQVWDGKARLDKWLIDYCGADDSAYTRAVSAKTLIGAVARVFEPGCKFDHVLVLEGEQGIGKSGVCRILGGEWFADFKIDADSKDTVQLMQGRWITEMAELHTMRQSDTDSLKSFLTRQSDQARFAYGRLPGTYPRQGIFIATYNPGPDGTYLKDDTGNRRWWPVKCEGVPKGAPYFNFKGLSSVRNQLFAEALARYRMGEALTMDTEELQQAATAAQKERHAAHPWTERIEDWIIERDKMPDTRKEFYTAREVWIFAMNGLDNRFDRREQLNVAKAMRELGWKPATARIGEDRRVTRGYIRSRIALSHANVPAVARREKEDSSLFGDML